MDARLELVEAAALASITEGAGLPVLRLGGASCTANPALPDNTFLNRVTGLGIERPVTDGELDEIEEFFRTHAARYAVAISPLAGPDLEARLRARGLSDGYAWMKFRRARDDPPTVETVLRIEQVRNGRDFGTVVAAAYGLPVEVKRMFLNLPERQGWHCFVAYDGEEAAGAAALFAQGGVGWLGAAGTQEQHRGKGAQTALLAARIRRAHELGLDAVATETGERSPGRPNASYRNILRAGFMEAYRRPNLVAP